MTLALALASGELEGSQAREQSGLLFLPHPVLWLKSAPVTPLSSDLDLGSAELL